MPGLGYGNKHHKGSWSFTWSMYIDLDAGGVSNTGVNYSEIATSIHKNGPDGLQRMEKSECCKIFNTNYVPDHSYVILMTNVTTANNSILGIDVHWPALQIESGEWFNDTTDTSHWNVEYNKHTLENGSDPSHPSW